MEVLAQFVVDSVKNETRFVDAAIGIFPTFETRSAVKKGLKKHRFLVNGIEPNTGTWIYEGDCISLLEDQSKTPKAYRKHIEIIFEDNDLAVVVKPPGMIVSGNQFKTLENCLVDGLVPSVAADAFAWSKPVHRLDAATSGLVLFAKNKTTRRLLGEMLEDKSIEKVYHAIVQGQTTDQEIHAVIDGKEATSKLHVLQEVRSLKNDWLSLVELRPTTGRTHQLRIHCAGIGTPIVGDQLYANEKGTFTHKGLFLSAVGLKLKHPMNGAELDFRMETPSKFESLLGREERRWSQYNGTTSV